MNKAQFIAALAPHFNGSKKEASHAVDIIFDTIVRNMVAGEDVMINDFGKFKKVDRKARMGRNPFTGETIKIKAMKKPRFLPAKGLKDAISGERKLGPAPKPVVVVAKPVAKPAAKKAVKKAPAKKKAAAKKPAAKKKVAAKKAPAKKKPVAKKKKK